LLLFRYPAFSVITFQVDQLLDLTSGQLLCSYCQTEVIEEAAAKPGSDTRSLMAKFNEEIEPIYSLLRKVEDIRLSNDILEPEPSDFKASKYELMQPLLNL
jgi:transcription initiation factor TFIIE subunit alpha